MNDLKNFQIVLLFVWMLMMVSCNSDQHSYRVFETTASKTSQVRAMSAPPAPGNGIKREELISPPDMEYDRQADEVSAEDSPSEATDFDEMNAGSSQEKPIINKKKIIKDGNISVKANDIATSKRNIDTVMKQLNAYYESEALNNEDRVTSYTLKIRIPAENFDKMIAAIENGQDEIISKAIEARDVTEEYIDIETRLINKKEYLKKYKELLSKAAHVKDILEIERNIRTIQEEIESKEGRLKYLNDQVAYCTLSMYLYHEKAYTHQSSPRDRFSERLKDSISNGWQAIVDFVLSLFAAWPIVTIFVVSFLLIRRFVSRRSKRKKIEES